MSDLTGETVSHYRILERVGQGGMGVVYKARDLNLDRFVALKFLPPALSRDLDSKARFINEAKSASRLQHENICTIHEISQTGDEQMFIVMDYYEGTTLKELLMRYGETASDGDSNCVPAIPLTDALDITIQTACGLQAAHTQGIIHRDIKPSNIIVTGDGTVKILDFGLARSIDHSGVTQTGQTPGTLAYMSPEQATGGKVDHRTDIWSMGVLLYEMIAGVRPFEAEIGPALVFSITQQQPRRLTEGRKDVPDALAKVVSRALEKNPDDRYQQMSELISDLQAAKEGRPLSRPPWRQRAAKFTKSSLARWIGVGAVLGITALLTILLTPGTQSEVIDSIAVLPLDNLSGDPAQEYFVDGMTDAIIGEMQKISSLRVISKTSVMQFKKKEISIPDIARKLNVKAIVEGSVLREDDKVKISVQLIQPSPEKSLWAETFQRKMENVIVLQENIATSIAREIKVTMTEQERKYLSSASKVNPEAYDAYLKGRAYRFMETMEATPKALTYCQLAVEKDSTFARAWSELSQAWMFLDFAFDPFPKYHRQSRNAINRALELDTAIAEVYVALAIIQMFYEFNWKDGERSLERAIELNPQDWNARREYGGLLVRTGRTPEAIAQLQRPREMDPLSNACMRELGTAYIMAGHHSLAKECLKKAMDAMGELSQWNLSTRDFFNSAQDMMVWEYLREDSVEKAKELCRLANPDLIPFVDALRADREHYAVAVRKLERLLDDPMSKCVYLSRVYCHFEDYDKAMTLIEEGCSIQRGWTAIIPTDPYLRSILSHPRYIALKEKINFP